jgi:small subunit ribosomal protein S11
MAEEQETIKTPASEAPATEAIATTDAPKAAPKRRKVKRSVPFGQVHILATFNNTIISFTDPSGGVLTYSSAGACGFRGSKKGTAYAAQVATEKAGSLAKQQFGLSKADVFVKGIGLGREAAVRSLSGLDIHVESIKDVTGVPHGGVRPRKARRV